MTLAAFQQVPVLASWFPYILSICIILFAFSTMISWCYYGERAWGYLFGLRSVILFRLFFVFCVFVGAVVTLGTVILFADAMLLSMASAQHPRRRVTGTDGQAKAQDLLGKIPQRRPGAR